MTKSLGSSGDDEDNNYEGEALEYMRPISEEEFNQAMVRMRLPRQEMKPPHVIADVDFSIDGFYE